MGRSSVGRASRFVLVHLLIPAGVAVAVGAAVAALVPPRFLAAGMPYFVGRAKNVEIAAVAAALAAGALAGFAADRRAWRWILGPLAAAGGWIVAARADGPELVGALPGLAVAAILGLGLRAWALAAAMPASRRQDSTAYSARAALVLGALAATGFLVTIEALTIDVFHQGEVLASAIDWLRGGTPFRSFVWPHGLVDTGLTAAWIALVGKVGSSPIALARASCAALGVGAGYVLLRRMGATRGAALAAVGGLVAAPVLFDQSALGFPYPRPLVQLGALAFALFGFAWLAGDGRWRALAAGACFGCEHLFRFEIGLFALIAGAASWAAPLATERARAGRERWREIGLGVGQLAAGFAVPLVAWRLVFGWPDGAWLRGMWRDLPRFHADQVGLPIDWPVHPPLAGADSGSGAPLLAWLLFALLAATAALAALRQAIAGDHGDRAPRRLAAITFVAALTAFTTRSALDRSDLAHVLQWGIAPLLGAAFAGVEVVARRFAWRPWASHLALGAGTLALGSLVAMPAGAPWRAPREIARFAAERVRLLAEHLAANPAAGPCGERGFTASEAARPGNRDFLAAVCVGQTLIAEHGIRELAVVDSGPWYWARFAMRPPTRFFSFTRAYTPALQLELVGELRASGAEALLRTHGFGAGLDMGVPTAVVAPVAAAFLVERGRGAPIRATELGDFVLWNEPELCRVAPAGGARPAVRLVAKLVTYQPTSRLLFARGWASEAAGGAPLAALSVAGPAELEDAVATYGYFWPGRAQEIGRTAGAQIGWELLARLAPGAWERLRARGGIDLRAVDSSGREADLALPLAAARELGPLAGPEWRAAAAAVAEAARLGRADRAAAVGGRTCTPRPALAPAKR
ncbi:MAG: hypothetical protein U0X73_17300 [Thermoanaerobaculia bacterium]